MKRLLSLLAVLMVALSIHAGLFGETRKVPGIVYYADGHKESCQTINIPYPGDKKITVVDEAGNKKQIQALDVAYLELWHPKNPEESREILWCCVDKKADGTKKFQAWSLVQAKGKYISFFTYGGKYVMRKTGLSMVGKNLWPGMFCLKPAMSGEYFNFGWWDNNMGSSNTVVKRLVEKYISDDPSLCKAIQEKKWKGKVPELLDFVAGTYSPSK